MKAVKECIQESGEETRFWRKEQGKTFEVVAAEKFFCEIVHIDDCVFKGEAVRRCDFLFLAKNAANVAPGNAKRFRKAFFVELKGIDVKSACEQLFNAINRTRTEFVNYETEALVVGIKGFQPQIANNEFFRKVKKLIGREIRFEKVHKGNNYTHTETI